MNRIIIGLIFFFASALVYGQNQKINSKSIKKGKIYFMRSTGSTDSAQDFTVFIDDMIVCKLSNKRFSRHNVTPGNHRFSVQFADNNSKEKTARIEIEVEAGKAYYIQLIFQNDILNDNLHCQEVTKNSANTMLDKLKEDSCQ